MPGGGHGAPAAGPGRTWWRAPLEVAPQVLVFVPILLTWLALFAATSAYQSLEGDAQARRAYAGRSFLELWQGNFGGRLTDWLSFGHVAIYTVIVVSTLIAVTVITDRMRRRDVAADRAARDAERAAARAAEEAARAAEDARRAALARLKPYLVRAQLELNQRRLASPARFAEELSSAAAGLRGLLERALTTQHDTAALARQNRQISAQLATSITELTQSVGKLEAAGQTLEATGQTVSGAATALSQTSSVLLDEVVTRVASASARLDQTVTEVAAKVSDLQRTGKDVLDDVTRRFDAAIAAVNTQIGNAAGKLVDAGDQFAAAIGQSSAEAAARIGQTSQEAADAAQRAFALVGQEVATTAVSLAADLSRTNAELRTILGDLSTGAGDYLTASAGAERSYAANTDRLASAVTSMRDEVDGLRQAVTTVITAQRELTGSLGAAAAGVAEHAGTLTKGVASAEALAALTVQAAHKAASSALAAAAAAEQASASAGSAAAAVAAAARDYAPWPASAPQAREPGPDARAATTINRVADAAADADEMTTSITPLLPATKE